MDSTPASSSNLPDGYLPAEEDRDKELAELFEKLDAGDLSKEQQRRLRYLMENAPPSAVMTATRHEIAYSGPLPTPGQLNGYDAETRRIIVQMAVDDQQHVHRMQETGMSGAIEKDKRGQKYGLAIAITGLLVAGAIAPFSAAASAIIGSVDLFGIVS